MWWTVIFWNCFQLERSQNVLFISSPGRLIFKAFPAPSTADAPWGQSLGFSQQSLGKINMWTGCGLDKTWMKMVFCFSFIYSNGWKECNICVCVCVSLLLIVCSMETHLILGYNQLIAMLAKTLTNKAFCYKALLADGLRTYGLDTRVEGSHTTRPGCPQRPTGSGPFWRRRKKFTNSVSRTTCLERVSRKNLPECEAPYAWKAEESPNMITETSGSSAWHVLARLKTSEGDAEGTDASTTELVSDGSISTFKNMIWSRKPFACLIGQSLKRSVASSANRERQRRQPTAKGIDDVCVNCRYCMSMSASGSYYCMHLLLMVS